MNVNQIVENVMQNNPYVGYNNLSQKVFAQIKDKYTLVQVEGRKGNYFLSHGNKYAFTLTTKQGISECRQYYKDLQGLFCYNIHDKELHFFDDILLDKKGSNLGNQSITAVTAWMENSKESRLSQRNFHRFMKECNA